MSLFSRIKRVISYKNIVGMTVSRFGSEFVVHVSKEHDYRFSSPNLKLKIVETLVDCFCKYFIKYEGFTNQKWDCIIMTIYLFNPIQTRSTKSTKELKKYIPFNLFFLMQRVWSKMSKSRLKAKLFSKARVIKITLTTLKNSSYWKCWEEELSEKSCYVRTKRIKNIMLSKAWENKILFRNNIWVKLELKDFYLKKVYFYQYS